jgi:hypothetical protein
MMDEERRAEAERILRRLDEQAEKMTGSSSLARPEPDWTERWGRRIGLILGYLLAVVLLVHLVANYIVR